MKKETTVPVDNGQPKEKPTPAYLRPDYPYPAVGDPITDINTLEMTGVLYEIKCDQCEMSIRSQGKNIKATYEKLMGGKGCIGCGNRSLTVRRVDMSRARELAKERGDAEKA